MPFSGEGYNLFTAVDGLIAHPGGGQTNAVLLVRPLSKVDTVASDHDSVILPPSSGGALWKVANNGAHILDVYPAVGQSFVGSSVNAPVSIAAGQEGDFTSFTTGSWWQTPASGGGGGGGPTVTTVALSASQINHLFSVPQTIIAAPGAGKAIVPISIQLAITVGTVPFDSENGDASIYYNTASGLHLSALELSNVTTSGIAAMSDGVAALASVTYAQVENLPIVAAGTGEDLINGGAVVTATVGAGGTGYAPGDTGTLNPQTTAIYVVDTVGGGGNVLTFHFSDAGYGNDVGSGKTTNVSTGGGDGAFTINVTSITPGNGAAKVTVTYNIVTLP
jgi:hypothetical protein